MECPVSCCISWLLYWLTGNPVAAVRKRKKRWRLIFLTPKKHCTLQRHKRCYYFRLHNQKNHRGLYYRLSYAEPGQ